MGGWEMGIPLVESKTKIHSIFPKECDSFSRVENTMCFISWFFKMLLQFSRFARIDPTDFDELSARVLKNMFYFRILISSQKWYGISS